MGLLHDVLDDTVDENSLGTKVAENDQWILWVNEMTRHYEKDLDSYGSDGYTLQGRYFVVLAENKIDGTRAYLAMDQRTQRPVVDWATPTEFDMKKMLLLEDLKQDSDIVNMAKKRKDKKTRRGKK